MPSKAYFTISGVTFAGVPLADDSCKVIVTHYTDTWQLLQFASIDRQKVCTALNMALPLHYKPVTAEHVQQALEGALDHN